MIKNIAIAAAALFSGALAAPAPAATAPSGSAGSVITGSYIVILKPGVDANDASPAVVRARDLHARSLHKRDTDNGVEQTFNSTTGFQGYSGTFDSKTIAEIKKDPDVAAVEQDRVWKVIGSPDEDVDVDVQVDVEERSIERRTTVYTQKVSTWGLGTVSHRVKGYTKYIYAKYAGVNTYAYVVDTGVMTTHSEFGGRASAAWTAFDGDNEDTYGHGTHVSGTIAGKTFGVAKRAKILSVKVFQGSSSSTSIILSGFDWAVNDIKTRKRASKAVINMSLGGSKSDAVNQAIEAAASAGIVCVVAAGNSGADASAYSPASAPNAITVGALESTWTIASYSNYGSALDIWAPGSQITSAGIASTTANATWSGTSMATPHVAGAVLYGFSINKISGLSAMTSWLKSTGTAKKITGGTKSSVNLIVNNGNTQQGTS